MRDFACRAMMVLMITEGQIHEMQERETARGYSLAPFEFEGLFRTGGIKDHYGIPKSKQKDMDFLAEWFEDAALQIKNQGLLKAETGGLISFGNLEALHSFDWMIWNGRDNLNFYVKTGPKKSQLAEFREAEAQKPERKERADTGTAD